MFDSATAAESFSSRGQAVFLLDPPRIVVFAVVVETVVSVVFTSLVVAFDAARRVYWLSIGPGWVFAPRMDYVVPRRSRFAPGIAKRADRRVDARHTSPKLPTRPPSAPLRADSYPTISVWPPLLLPRTH